MKSRDRAIAALTLQPPPPGLVPTFELEFQLTQELLGKEYHEGPATNPNATITVDSDDWLKILKDELNPVTAFMSGRLRIAGDMGLMMQFQNWFARPQ